MYVCTCIYTLIICSGPSSVREPPSIVPSPTSTPTITGTPSATVLIAVGTGLAFSVLIVFIVMCVLGQCLMSRRYRLANRRSDHNSSIKTSSSPQIRSETSDISINTEETGSTHVPYADPCFKKRPVLFARNPSNPPNSPITGRSFFYVTEDNRSFVTESDFYPPVPSAPNPSLNFEADAFSDKMSSVSQRRCAAVLPHNGTYHHRVAPTYHPQPRQLHYPSQHSSQFNQFQPVQHTVPAMLMESDNLSQSSYNSRLTPTGDFADTSFMDAESVLDPHTGFYDPVPPPSPVTEYCAQTDDEETFS